VIERGPGSPFLRDVPLPQALRAWADVRAETGCPERLDAVTVPVVEAVGRVTAAPVWALRSSPAYDAAAMDGIAVRAADTVGASESTPLLLDQGAFIEVDTGDPLPDGCDAVVMREHVHHSDGTAELRAAVPPQSHVRSIGEDVAATELLLAVGHRLRWPPSGSPSWPCAGLHWWWSSRAATRSGQWGSRSARARSPTPTR
jgi:putative molybdopterin biosynthesis protein